MKGKWILLGGLVSVLMLALAVGLTQAQGPEPPEGGVQPQGSAGIQALMDTAFTYQGQLKKEGNPYNGTCDFSFSLWDAASSGNRIGPLYTRYDISVSNGIFTIPDLNFGPGVFNGDARWLEIAVRCPAGSGSFTTLSPRQKLNPVPYALALPGLWTQQNITSTNLIGGYSGNTVSPGVVGATIGGGGTSGNVNRATDNYGTVSGGFGNQAGDNAGTTSDRPYATVGGGYRNTAGHASTTVSGGWQNTASENAATVSGGADNTASGEYATIGGGRFNTASGDYATVPGGYRAVASQYGQMAYASGRFASDGDAQTSIYVLRGTTTGTTWTDLYLDGSSARITIGPNRTMTFDILIVGRSNANESGGYRIHGVVEREGDTVRIVEDWHLALQEDDDDAWDARVVIEGTALCIQVRGNTGDNVRWVAVVRTVEVSW